MRTMEAVAFQHDKRTVQFHNGHRIMFGSFAGVSGFRGLNQHILLIFVTIGKRIGVLKHADSNDSACKIECAHYILSRYVRCRREFFRMNDDDSCIAIFPSMSIEISGNIPFQYIYEAIIFARYIYVYVDGSCMCPRCDNVIRIWKCNF